MGVAGCSIAACGGGDSGGGSSSAATIDALTTCSEILMAACEAARACGLVVEETATSYVCIGDCQAVVDLGSDDCVSRAAPGETFPRASVDSCVADFAAGSCNDLCAGYDPPACANFERLSSGGQSAPLRCDPACVNVN